MPNYNKQKGNRWEYNIKHSLEMLGFTLIRAYSSIGTADLIGVPPYNPKGNSKSLLIQAKDTKAKDYIDPFERTHLDYLQSICAGVVCIFYKDNSKCMVKIWETSEKITFEEFLLKYYGIPCSFPELVKGFKEFRRPIHLYPIDKEIYTGRDGKEKEKPIAPFADLYSVNTWYPHTPEKYKDKHL